MVVNQAKIRGSESTNVLGRLSRVEQDISAIEATLEGQGELLREIRNEQLRPKPSTNWIGIITLSLTLVAGGGVYVNTQTNPIKEDIEHLSLESLAHNEKISDLRVAAAKSEVGIDWLTKLESRAYLQRRAVQKELGNTRGEIYKNEE